MGKSKALELPPTPTQQFNPNLKPNIDFGSKYNTGLLQGDFTGDRSWLSSLVNPDNSANALSYAQGLLAPQFRDNIQNITNQAVANNQNTSSTFTDALAKASGDTNSQYQAILAQQAINDSNQANANKLSLLGQGQQGLQAFTGLAQNQTNAENQFNLDNYSNLVADAIQNNKNANRLSGWEQAISLVNPLAHDYYQSQGRTNVSGYGVADVAKIASLFVPGNGGFQGGGLSSQQSLASGGSAPFAGAYSGNNAGLSGGYGQFAQQQRNPFQLGGGGY